MSHKMTLGIDFGGSSSKVTLLEDTGRVVAAAGREYNSYFPKPGWYEQDADELFEAFVINTREIISKSGINTADIAAVCVDAATHMAVFCDEDDRPIRNFIHWSDSRSTKQVEFLKKNYAELIKKHTVNSVSAAWTLPQMLWLRENEPEVLKKTKRIYFAKDYIRHRMTGDFCTDYVEAMGAMLCDDYTQEWCRELCDIAGIDMSVLPPIRKPTDIAGYINTETELLTGLKAGTPVLVGAPDTAMEVYASGAVAEGTATIKLATAGRICPVTSGAIPSHQFFNYKHVIPGMWYPGTGTRACAAAYKWYREVFGAAESAAAKEIGTSTYEVLNRAAEQAQAGSGGVLFHPYLQGEMTPYFDDSLCASFTGVKSFHTKGHFTRAVMEGVAYSMRDCLEEVKKQNINIDQYRLIGGGAKGKLWRQILSDVLAMPLTCTMDNDSSLGSAMLAGVAVGMFADFADSVQKCVVVADEVTPDPENIEIYDKGFKAYKISERTLQQAYHEIEAL